MSVVSCQSCRVVSCRVVVGQTWEHVPSSHSSCLACFCANPTDETPLLSRAAWRCRVFDQSTWCSEGSSRGSVASSARTPTSTWRPCHVASAPNRRCFAQFCHSRANFCSLQHFTTSTVMPLKLQILLTGLNENLVDSCMTTSSPNTRQVECWYGQNNMLAYMAPVCQKTSEATWRDFIKVVEHTIFPQIEMLIVYLTMSIILNCSDMFSRSLQFKIGRKNSVPSVIWDQKTKQSSSVTQHLQQ